MKIDEPLSDLSNIQRWSVRSPDAGKTLEQIFNWTTCMSIKILAAKLWSNDELLMPLEEI